MSPLEYHTASTSLLQMGSPDEHPCNTGLSLSLAGFENNKLNLEDKVHSQTCVSSFFKFDHLSLPPLSLGPPPYHASDRNCAAVKRPLTASDEKESAAAAGGSLSRKKLRLTKDQYAFLEDAFSNNATLNPKQKQALAKQLNLRPRQVEVWFQNRRARTKLKQTETECELLKKCCEKLTEENRRLHKEVVELKPLQQSVPAICPSCDIDVQLQRPKPTTVFISDNAAPNQSLIFPRSSAAC